MDLIYRIICYKEDYSLTIRGGNVVFALTNHFDRYQHWIKDERHGDTIKDSEGEPAFAVINKATGQAISHCPTGQPLVKYNVNSCDKSVLWTMSGLYKYEGFRIIRRVDDISVCFHIRGESMYEGNLLDLTVPGDETERWKSWDFKFEVVSPSTCISLFRRPSLHTVKIICKVKEGYNLAIDKDGRTILLVPSNPKDKYQVQVAPFNTNYMDPSLLWTERRYSNSYKEIRMQNNDLVFALFDDGRKYPLLGLSKSGNYYESNQNGKIEDFE